MTSGDYLGYRSYGGEAELHCHDFHQLVLPHRGVLELEIGGRGGAVGGSRGALIAAGTPHAFRAPGENNGFVVVDVMSPNLAEADLERFETCAFFDIRPPVRGLLDYLSAMVGGAGEASGPVRKAWCTLLFDALSAAPPAGVDRAGRPLGEAIAFMRANLHRPVTVADSAQAAGVSETMLHTLFRTTHGTSPHAFLMELRLDEALRLLSGSQLSVAEIALRTGHADQSSLTRRLRLSRGITPSAFRRTGRVESA